MEPHRNSVDSVARAYRIPTSQRGLSAENVRSPRWAPAPHQKKRSGDAEKKRGARPLKSVGCLAESVSSRYSNLRWITSDLDRVHAALGGTSAQRPAIQNLRLPPSRRATVASSPRDAALKQLPGRRGGGGAANPQRSVGQNIAWALRKCASAQVRHPLHGSHALGRALRPPRYPGRVWSDRRVPLPVFDAGLSPTRKKINRSRRTRRRFRHRWGGRQEGDLACTSSRWHLLLAVLDVGVQFACIVLQIKRASPRSSCRTRFRAVPHPFGRVCARAETRKSPRSGETGQP